MASGLNFLTNAIEVFPAAYGSWQDVDVSSYIPTGATGVILYIESYSTGGSALMGIRKNGSSDSYYCYYGVLQGVIVGVDASRIFEARLQDSGQRLFLIGYTDSSVTLFDNGIDKSTGTAGSYQDVDVSGDGVPSGATGAVFFFHNTGASDYNCALRKNGSSDDIYAEVEGDASGGILWGICGLDANRICEQKIANTAVDLKLIGYTLAPVTFLDNAVDKSLTTTGSWVDIDLTSDTAASADGAIFSIKNTGSGSYNHGLQHKNSTDDYLEAIWSYSLLWRHVGLDSGQVCEGYIANVAVDFYLRGYCYPTGAVTEKTSADTGAGADAYISLETGEAKTSSDVGAGAEGVPLPGATLTGSQAGSGIEALIFRLLAGVDTGTGTEVAQVSGLFQDLFASELGRGYDLLTAKIEIPTKGGGMKLWT